jgi:hypothetical protein
LYFFDISQVESAAYPTRAQWSVGGRLGLSMTTMTGKMSDEIVFLLLMPETKSKN